MRENISLKAFVLLSILIAIVSVGITRYVYTSGSEIAIEKHSFIKCASYIIEKDGSTIKAFNGTTGELYTSGLDAVTVIQSAIGATPDGGTVVVRESNSVLELSNVLQINKNVNFYCYAKLKACDFFPTWRVIEISASDIMVYLYELDGNKAGNSEVLYNGVDFKSCQNVEANIHTKNMGYGDVGFKGQPDRYNKNVRLHLQSEDSGGGRDLNFVVHLSPCNDNIVISGHVQNVTTKTDGGQVLYVSGTLGVVTLKDFKAENIDATKPVIDVRTNGTLFIDNVELKNLSPFGMMIYPDAEVYAENLRMLEVNTSSYGITNRGLFIGSNIKVEGGVCAVETRMGSDHLMLNGFELSGSTSYHILVRSDSKGHHTVVNGKIIGAYGVRDNCTRKSIFENLDLSGVTATRTYGAVVRDSVGWVEKNCGVVSITGSYTSVVVTHGLSKTPIAVLVTPEQDGQGKVWVSAIGSTSFSINFDNQPGTSTWYFNWYAEYQP